MFENTLMIIKPDYIHKRKSILLKLLSEGFLIQTQRKLLFSPESAAEFYADYTDEKGFMLEVILLAKGTSEAFILTKENALNNLIKTMICYFSTTLEMERNVHVTKHHTNVAREINFIFPNYIHEPTPLFDRDNFCNRPMLKPLIEEIYNMLQNEECSGGNWKLKVVEYLERSNSNLPIISNQCMHNPDFGLQDTAQQTVITYDSTVKDAQAMKLYKSSTTISSPLSISPAHSSMLLTSSSCATCAPFERSEICIPTIDFNKRLDKKKVCEDEEIIWKEVIVYEEVLPEEEDKEKEEIISYVEEAEYEEAKLPTEQPNVEVLSEYVAIVSTEQPVDGNETNDDDIASPDAVSQPVSAVSSEVVSRPAASEEPATAEEPIATEEPTAAEGPVAAKEPTAVEELPTVEVLLEEASAEAAPAEEAPVKDEPAEKAPAEEAPAEEVYAEKPPTEEA